MTSHYNVNTPFDAAIFATMGAMIANNTVLVFVLLILFSVGRREVPRPYLWGFGRGWLFFLRPLALEA